MISIYKDPDHLFTSDPAGNGSATVGTAIPCNTITHTVTAGAVIGVLLGLLLIGI